MTGPPAGPPTRRGRGPQARAGTASHELRANREPWTKTMTGPPAGPTTARASRAAVTGARPPARGRTGGLCRAGWGPRALAVALVLVPAPPPGRAPPPPAGRAG